MSKGKVLIGMSGGVDSSVSALLLKQEGYDVIGATMILWEDEDSNTEKNCCVFSNANDAKKVCEKIGIPHYVFDCRKEFKSSVIDDFISCYTCARTPNPCIECNKHLKFDLFYKKALELGCDYISTGHYAKVEFSEKYNQYVMKKSAEYSKDQTYFLYSINRDILSKLIFPLKNFREKSEIRKIAEDNGLVVAKKPDSQEICFIPDNNYKDFLEKNIVEKPKEGNIVLQGSRQVVGRHKGLIYYTIGQRKGLGVSYKEPLYVLRLDKNANEVIVGTEDMLYANKVYANEVNFLVDIDLTKPMIVKAKIRYGAKEENARLSLEEDGSVKLEFENKQRAITPGQSVVFYLEDVVLGGGKIYDKR